MPRGPRQGVLNALRSAPVLGAFGFLDARISGPPQVFCARGGLRGLAQRVGLLPQPDHRKNAEDVAGFQEAKKKGGWGTRRPMQFPGRGGLAE